MGEGMQGVKGYVQLDEMVLWSQGKACREWVMVS